MSQTLEAFVAYGVPVATSDKTPEPYGEDDDFWAMPEEQWRELESRISRGDGPLSTGRAGNRHYKYHVVYVEESKQGTTYDPIPLDLDRFHPDEWRDIFCEALKELDIEDPPEPQTIIAPSNH